MSLSDVFALGASRLETWIPRVVVDLFGYMSVSVLALSCDCGLLFWLVHSGVHYIVASTLSFSAGMGVAYALSIRVVFSDRRAGSKAAEAIGFVAVGVAGLALTQVLLYALVTAMGIALLVAKIVTVGIVFVFNFLGRRHLVFVGSSGQ